MTARVLFHSEVVEKGEDKSIDKGDLRKVVRRLEDNPQAGKPLKRDLATFRSIRVEGSQKRVIFRPSPDGTVVEILAIGKRTDAEAYTIAQARK